MRVRCIDPQSQAALKFGNSYTVIELTYDGKEYSYRLICEGDDSPGIFPANCFEVTDSKVSSHSVFIFHDAKRFTLTQEYFLAGDFWERFFNGEPEAISVYESVIVPLSKITLTIEHINTQKDFSWGNMQYLLHNRWCDVQTAIDLATHKISATTALEDEIELAGLSKREVNEVQRLLTKLAEDNPVDTVQITEAVMKWYLASCKLGILDFFESRLAEKLGPHAG